MDAGLNNLGNFRNTLRGSLRINGNLHAFRYVLWKKLQSFIRRYPEISLEPACEPRMVDIVAERFDAGIRLGGYIAQDMVSVRISPPLTMRIIASPAYLSAHGTPQTPADLSAHECHSSRQPTTGAVWTWDLRHPQSGKTLQFHPQARLLADGSSELLKQIALADLGLVCVFDDIVSRELASGALVSVLDDWAISYDGYYLYYPNHHISSPVLNALVAALRE
ncbi:LysR substrate-binding domain-containing protein [Neisseria sp. WF04]|uniref:LysR substrate-binding domain-containing protein n=1 Tax=unclassified Neisseria TaxID=2623750 RepID=UPI00211052A8|nr:LysR substrate-binding domain-containing protein [Neisseria sp. WF04]